MKKSNRNYFLQPILTIHFFLFSKYCWKLIYPIPMVKQINFPFSYPLSRLILFLSLKYVFILLAIIYDFNIKYKVLLL